MNVKNKIAVLLQQKRQIYHTQDFAVLWGIQNTNTLYTTIKRYTDRNIFFPVYKGLYSTVAVGQLDPLELGIKALHRYAYVSCETVLQKHGLINQVIQDMTLVSSQSRRFVIGPHSYRVRKLHDAFLYQTIGIEQQGSLRIATPLRALADVLYFNPHAHIDAPVDWNAVRNIQRTIGYPLTKRS